MPCGLVYGINISQPGERETEERQQISELP